MENIILTHIDTACILIEINGYRILTDPTFDERGNWYYHGSGSFSRKTDSPAINPEDLPPIDLILLSHHQHKDNFDNKGKAFAMSVPLILSTKDAAKEITGVTGLSNWECYTIIDKRLGQLKIIAAPAQHRPWWVPEFFSGKVIGFILEWEAEKKNVVYISGDTVYFGGIREVARRFKIDVGIFHVGSVEFRYLTGFGRYTMNSKDLISSVNSLNPKVIIPIHHRGWSHFKERETTLQKNLSLIPDIAARTIFLTSGKPIEIEI